MAHRVLFWTDNKPEQAIELHSNPKKEIKIQGKFLNLINIYRVKPDPGQKFSGKIFAYGDSPEHLEFKYLLLKTPDSAPKIGISVSGEKSGTYKNLSF